MMTMNVYGPSNPEWDSRIALISDTLRTLAPDVMALQEIPVDEESLEKILGPGTTSRPSRSND